MANLLTQLLQDQQRLQTEFARTVVQVSAAQQEARTVAKNAENTMQAAEAAKLATKALQSAGAVAEAENARTIASAFGVNIADANNLIVPTAAIARTAAERANNLVMKAEEGKQIDFLKNPLAAIGAMFTVPMYENAATDQAKVSLSASNRLVALNQGAQATIQTEQLLKRSVTAEVAAADAEAAKLASDLIVQALKEKNLRQGAQDAVALLTLNKDQVSLMFQANAAVNDAERLNLQRQQFKLSQQEFEWKSQERNRTQEEELQFVGTVNAGRQTMGLSPMTRGEISNYLKLGGEARGILEVFYKTGALKTATGITAYASDPVSSVIMLNTAGAKFEQGHPKNSIVDLVNNAQIEFRKTPQGQQAKPQDVIAGTNAVLATKVKSQLGNIVAGDGTNIYAALPFSNITDSLAVQQTELFGKLLKTQKDAGVIDIPPQQLFSQTAQMVSSGQMTIEQAASDFATYMKVAVELNNRTRDYGAFGLPRQKNYVTTLPRPPVPTGPFEHGAFMIPGFVTNPQVDLTNESEVLAALVRYRSAAALTPQNPHQEWLKRQGAAK